MDLKQQLKQYEGTKEYQTKVGYFKNGKYWPYKDSLGYWTIGFGHLVLKGEDFSTGQADALLDKDIAIARAGVLQLGVTLPADSRWNDFLVMMVFQLGLTKTRGFKKFLAALNNGNYARAIIEVKDSAWYRQTPARVDSMIAYVVRG
ncbi:glycoside hydrolase family protein [Serratia nevei]|uniref:glycoside hydrolase family protein n=1 Tax=Serratia nevei TaxID=2703794 RepID=UPI0036922102